MNMNKSEHTQGNEIKPWDVDINIDDDPVYEQLRTKVRRKVIHYRMVDWG